ncbi:MAG TPA: 3'-5' exonuclease, partial [Candidatus Nitrosotenuis sp.]|nr:3'-5' exonuclease [Candidatus Nitrosotenuis sp.]
DRTLFVVGDAKQAIYSFQGANPKDFLSFRSFFADRLQKTQFPWQDVELNVSFRSTPTILDLVDRIFADPAYQQAMLTSSQNIRHRPHRLEAQGIIKLWPPVLDDQNPLQLEPWPLPPHHFDMESSVEKLANYVADQIAEMVQKGLYLPATQSPAQPKDILILLRKRSAIVLELIRALKMRQIPVAGADRLVLHDHIVVEDLLSLAKFALLPDDDLSLAEVLKSPFVGLSEEELFELAHNREGNLWQEVKKSTESPAYLFLSDMLGKVDYLPPYQWFQRALIHHRGREKVLERLGTEAEDILYEFISGVLNYQLTTRGSLQQFVDYFLANPLEIKRDSSNQQYNQVRIMTVHGAKGLQAPIVILLDQLDGREPIDRLLWQTNDQGHVNFMLLRPSQDKDVPLSRQLKQEAATAHDAEDKRLLYVALTRAQDHLFIGGWGKKINDECWYAIIQNHYNQIPHSSPKFQKSAPVSQELSFPIPEWLHLPPQTWLTGLTPQSSAAKVALTPAISRGIILHKLLEVLADCPHHQRLFTAQHTLASFKENIKDWGDDLTRLFTFLDHPDWHFFFGHNSQAEVDIHGIVDGHRFHGRVDRLVELDKEVWILDYKSSLQTLPAFNTIPPAYRTQLQSYKACLKSLYPCKTIRCFILWLETLTLVEVE